MISLGFVGFKLDKDVHEFARLLMVMMIFWEVLLERFVGKLCGGCCGSFGENDIEVTKRHQCDEK